MDSDSEVTESDITNDSETSGSSNKNEGREETELPIS